jgi:protein involved in polysaccharide export with SLBB domain
MNNTFRIAPFLLIFLLSLIIPDILTAAQVNDIKQSPSLTSQPEMQKPSDAERLRGFYENQGTPPQRFKRPDDAAIPRYREQAEELSQFELFAAGIAPEVISTRIRQFGYDLFRNVPAAFTPSADVPVGPDYVIGPGDEIRLTIWGKIEGNWNVEVDRDGNISLPKVGVLGVTGLTFSELRSLLRKELSKYYTGFEMNVSMGSLRTIRIYVVGNTNNPGAYTVSSLSTLVNALIQTGGPAKTGSMRDIQVKRNGETVVRFDMYDFLLSGDKTNDVRLMPEDVIFIPPVGPLAGIAGNVKNPAIYELKGETRLLDIIRMGSGLASSAFRGRVQVLRVADHEVRTLFEGDLVDLEETPDKNFLITDGDLIKIFPVAESSRTVRLAGAVGNEGEYAIEPGVTRLSDVIAKAGGLLYYASGSAELTRLSVTPAGPVTDIRTIDAAGASEGSPEHDILLHFNDYILVQTIPEWGMYQTVSIHGEVKFPGNYTIKKGDTLSSLISRAGGYTDKAYLRGAVFTRERVRRLQQKSIEEMISRLEAQLLAGGSMQVSTAVSTEEVEATKVELQQKEKFMQSLRKSEATGRMAIRLAHLRLLKNSQYDIELESGDTLTIPLKSSEVHVIGSVMAQGSFIYADDLNEKDYLAMAGGYSRYADRKNAYVLKVDGSARKLSNGLVSWNLTKDRWEVSGFGDEIKAIEPGDTIVVPEKLDRHAWMREIKDITQILYQIAVSAGVLIVAF